MIQKLSQFFSQNSFYFYIAYESQNIALLFFIIDNYYEGKNKI